MGDNTDPVGGDRVSLAKLEAKDGKKHFDVTTGVPPEPPSGPSWRTLIGFCGALAIIWVVGAAFVIGAQHSGYSPRRDPISLLGAQGSTNQLTANLVIFGVTALLYALYAIAVRNEFGLGLLFGLTAVQTIAVAGSGLSSCDPGCPQAPHSTQGLLHIIFGLGFFALCVLAPFVAARRFRRRDDWRSLVPFALVMGVILAVLFALQPVLGATRIGLWQRGFLVAFVIWQLAVGLRMARVKVKLPWLNAEGGPKLGPKMTTPS